MRSQNAARAPGGRSAIAQDRFSPAFALAALCGLTLLAACGAASTPAPVVYRVPPSGAPPPVAPPSAAMAVPPAIVVPVPPTPPSPLAAAPAPLPPLPTDLTGMAAAEVVALLGSPDFRRGEPPGELWQYRRPDCVLDVFLYADKRGAHVVHTETRPRRTVVAADGGGCDASPASFTSRQNRL
jgi:hypothetical protein